MEKKTESTTGKKPIKKRHQIINNWNKLTKLAHSEINTSLGESRQLSNITNESRLTSFQKHVNNPAFINAAKNAIAILLFVIVG